MRLQVTLAFALGLSAFCTSSVNGAIIDGLSPSRHNRFVDPTFAGGTPPTVNSSFFLSQYDFSGVGWLPAGVAGTKNFALISPQHFIFAQHATGGLAGQNVAFRAKDGTYVTRTVTGFTQIGATDVVVGELSSPVPGGPNGVAYYSVSTGLPGQYLGKQLLMYDQGARVGRNVAWQVFNLSGGGIGPTDCLVSDYDTVTNFDGQGLATPSPPSDETLLTNGDSGAPTFLFNNEELILLGAHTATVDVATMGVPDGNADSFLPNYITNLQSILSADGFTLSTISVPEPSSMLLGGLVVGGTLWARRRRKP